MRMALGNILGVLLGGFLGYMVGYYLACEAFNGGNLCGLAGVFITGPLGAIAGGIGGALVSRKHLSPPAAYSEGDHQ
jgi:hypothetical protein